MSARDTFWKLSTELSKTAWKFKWCCPLFGDCFIWNILPPWPEDVCGFQLIHRFLSSLRFLSISTIRPLHPSGADGVLLGETQRKNNHRWVITGGTVSTCNIHRYTEYLLELKQSRKASWRSRSGNGSSRCTWGVRTMERCATRGAWQASMHEGRKYKQYLETAHKLIW